MADDKYDDFCTEMREKTKVIHDQSDRLINLKLAVVLTDTALWSDVLADFYVVFQTIEQAMDQHRDHPYISQLFHPNMLRTSAFEADLQFYLGKDWRGLIRLSEPARVYADRILKVSEDDPVLLIAYIHSMYLALLAGGQILKRIIKKTLGISDDKGLSIFVFDNISRPVLRKHITMAINSMDIDRHKKDKIIQEKIRCFQMNNAIAGSVNPTMKNYSRIFKFLFIVFCIVLMMISLAVMLWRTL